MIVDRRKSRGYWKISLKLVMAAYAIVPTMFGENQAPFVDGSWWSFALPALVVRKFYFALPTYKISWCRLILGTCGFIGVSDQLFVYQDSVQEGLRFKFTSLILFTFDLTFSKKKLIFWAHLKCGVFFRA